jgi:Tol biopolymer transport system component
MAQPVRHAWLRRAVWLAALLALAACSIIPTPNDFPPRPTDTPGSPVTAQPTAATPASGTSGRLLLTVAAGTKQATRELVLFDLATGARTTLFKPPAGAWLNGAVVSPDGKELLLAYAPPAAPGELQLGYTGLYQLPLDGEGDPQPLLPRTLDQESFFEPVWAPDGHSVYYAHFTGTTDASGNAVYRYTLERLALGGQPEVLVEDAIWPRLSADGRRLAYVTFQPQGTANALLVADADGHQGRVLVPEQAYPAVDAPLFAPDGQSLIFSAVVQQRTPQMGWLDWLTGVQAAEAHNIPSDLYRVPLAGGPATRLTELADVNLYPINTPDGAHVIFIGSSGLWMMNPDGSDLTKLLNGVAGVAVDWIP